MKKLIALALVLVTVLSMAACGGGNTGATEPTKKKDNFNYPEVKEPVTWEQIEAFPMKSADMTTQEMRELCVDFFRFSKLIPYVPNASSEYEKNPNGTIENMYQGVLYRGVPYVNSGGGTGNVYRFMNYYDSETGILDMERMKTNMSWLGNHCSTGTLCGWGRVINSANYDTTNNMVQFKGFLRVGPYTYDDMMQTFDKGQLTADICKTNGTDTMFESYAQLHLADGMVNYSSGGGHVIMASSEPTVVRTAEGKIDGNLSYITIIEQHQQFQEVKDDDGTTYLMEKCVDDKRTFLELYESSYIPFTFAEFLGTNPIEETEVSFSHTGDTINAEQLFTGVVTANYGICENYAVIKNKKGEEVYRHFVGMRNIYDTKLAMKENGEWVDTWGTLDLPKGDYTVEVQVRLYTGELLTAYTGKWVP